MKGICFTEEMFNAVIDGRKTQTRRIMKPQPQVFYPNGNPVLLQGDDNIKPIKPRYKAGETVYLKEPYCLDCDFIQHKYSKEWKANGKIRYKYNGDELSELSRLAKGFNVWSNKLFMLEKYARYFIKIEAVRCERLQDISEREDCLKEGIEELNAGEIIPNYQDYIQYSNGDEYNYDTPQKAYAALINKIYGKGTWESNPYVWVYDFKLTIKN